MLLSLPFQELLGGPHRPVCSALPAVSLFSKPAILAVNCQNPFMQAEWRGRWAERQHFRWRKIIHHAQVVHAVVGVFFVVVDGKPRGSDGCPTNGSMKSACSDG